MGNKAYYANKEIFKSKLVSMKTKSKVILDYNKTCDNICQWNMGAKRIYEMKIINNWKEDIKKNIWTYKGQRWHMGN